MQIENNLRGWHFRDNGSPTPDVIAGMYELATFSLAGGLGVYGADAITQRASQIIIDKLNPNAEVYFTVTGTLANIIGTLLPTKPTHVICSACSHLIWLESRGPEKAGVTLYPARSDQGKLTIELIEDVRRRNSDLVNAVQLTQCSEFGTVYTKEELRAIGDYCRENNLLFGLDGARIAHAMIHNQSELRELTQSVGVDYFTTGVAKVGGLAGNVLVVVDRTQTAEKGIFLKDRDTIFSMIKEKGGTPSNLWHISGQFVNLFEHDDWRRHVSVAMELAAKCANILAENNYKPAFPVQTNSLFIRAGEEAQEQLAARGWHFFCWPSESDLIRFMYAFNTPDHLPELLAQDILELRANGYL